MTLSTSKSNFTSFLWRWPLSVGGQIEITLRRTR